MQPFAQVPDPAFNPMTAPGARGISGTNHILYWQNPENVIYNEVYFSSDSNLVANLDSNVRVKNGFPSSIYSSYSTDEFGNLYENKYFLRVVEYNGEGFTASMVWDFYTFVTIQFEHNYNFDTGLDGWQIIGPQGLTNWFWSNSTHTQSNPGEAVFRWDPIFVGDSYLISPEINSQSGQSASIHFNYFENWWSDTVVVGCAITSDNGINWSSIWELNATGNVGPYNEAVGFNTPDKFRIGFYYTGNSNNIDFFYLDNISIFNHIPLSGSYPPRMLTSVASQTEEKVTLNWSSGWAPSGFVGYEIQRKVGLPTEDSIYFTIAITDLSTQNYSDFNVELNQAYTYRVRLIAMGNNSSYGNEATAYVPSIVPVEFLSFSSSVNNNDVTLNWTTATETNNSGFQIERNTPLNPLSRGEAEGRGVWESIGFVNGNGTTTETKSYSYKDENLSSGKYQYRLKQIDFDGTFEYSNIVEAEILPPLNFSLDQNYPNPFNPSTNIQYTIPSRQFVSLKIFNPLGEEIETLVNEYQEAGVHSKLYIVHSTLPSGVYLYQLKAGEFIQTRKMILLK